MFNLPNFLLNFDAFFSTCIRLAEYVTFKSFLKSIIYFLRTYFTISCIYFVTTTLYANLGVHVTKKLCMCFIWIKSV